MLVSAIIAVLNGEMYLSDAIESVLAQTYPAHEIIIIDDGSTDRTSEIISSYSGKIKSFRQEHTGVYAAQNLGIEKSSGNAIAFLDHDDLWPKNRLLTMVSAMREDETSDAVAGIVELRPESGVQLKSIINNRTAHRPFMLQSALIRRTAFDRIGKFNANFLYAMDIDWYNRAQEEDLKYKLIPDVTLIYRMHKQNMTRDADATRVGILNSFKLALDRKRRRSSE